MDDDRTMLTIAFTAEQVAAIDGWIARHPEPRPDREAAVREIVAGRLATHSPATILPGLVTGRDIV